MDSHSHECYRCTLFGLAVAFLELALAYCLLCLSTFLFLASKFLHVFGLYLPCPCSGILGFKDSSICFHKLLFDWPLRRLYTIQNLAWNRLPYELVWHQEQDEVDSGDEDCEITAFETGYSKGLNQKSKIRGSCGIRKSSPSDSDILDNEGSTSYDEQGDSSSDVKGITGNETNIIKVLKKSLREEREARAALMMELEEERAAAATSVEEAMTMILRLQGDKASLEMEAKQYERMMEEKFEYNEEEMKILGEILIRREREKYFLEKELEAYKQIDDPPQQIVYDVHVVEDNINTDSKIRAYKESEGSEDSKNGENQEHDNGS